MGLLNAIRRGIRAYHGSPHDFDRFSMAHIGRGEGAQAYGHGLYFAEREGVAKYYRDGLSIPTFEVPRGLSSEATTKLKEIASVYDNNLSKSELDAVLRDARETWEPWIDEIQDAANSGMIKFNNNPGRMYEVNINAAPEEFLDWDAPLMQQPDAVRQRVAQVMAGGDPLVADLLGDLSDPGAMQIAGLFPASKGSQVYNTLTEANKETVTQRLRDAGIPGIRYLDGNSRSAGEGSRNYVVFDDSLIEILRKYGLVGSAGTGGGLLSYLTGRQQQQGT